MSTTGMIGFSIVILIFIVINMNAITQTINGDIGNVEFITNGNNELSHISRTTMKQASTLNSEISTSEATTLPETEAVIKTMYNNKNITTTKVNENFETLLNTMRMNSMTVQKIEISAAKPSNFNKNSLHQSDEAEQAVREQQQYQEQSPQQQRHHKHQYNILDNKHPPCEYAAPAADATAIYNGSIVTDGVESITTTNNSINNNTRKIEFDVSATGTKPLITQNTLNGAVTKSNNKIKINNSRTLLSKPTSQSPSPSPSLSPSPSPSESPSLSSTFNVARNGFRDKINISNQQNEFTSQVDDGADDVGDSGIVILVNTTTHRGEHVVDFHSQVQLVTSTTRKPSQKYKTNIESNNGISSRNRSEVITNTHNTITNAVNNYVVPATSSFFEHVELLESRLSSDKRNELRLHRRKRYLVFPEGSSFQLVFDLIIGIVDYTSYAILGITCSVAWELPSKPPSEIIENFREKLNEGKFGLNRRNDSTDNDKLQYIETKNKNPATTTQLNTNFQYENVWKPQKYEGKENYYQQQEYYAAPKVATALPIVTRYNDYKAQNEYGKFDGNGGGNGYVTATDMTAGVPLAEAQRKTLNEKAAQREWKWQEYSPKADKAYKKYEKVFSTKKNYEWLDNDKWKYASTDWHRQRMNKNRNRNDNFNEHNEDDDNDFNADTVNYDKIWQRQKNHMNWHKKDNWQWWQYNNQRWRDKLQQKQPFKQYGPQNQNWDRSVTKRPITVYAIPVSSDNARSNDRRGYQRTLLKEPPKHRIYPVFGRKKRSLNTTPNDEQSRAFELKLERIHLREQLRSRQKLYGKIEQLFQTRGHNGTACVLRALCENGQRHQVPLHHRHRHRRHRACRHPSQCQQHDHEEQEPHSTADQQSGPQSFITELLRAIFALPKDIRSSREYESQAMHSFEHEFEEHISWHYRDAHAFAGNCAERFSSCEHSIWNDGIRHTDVAGREFKM